MQAKDAHVGSVKQYSTPAAPKPPSVPSDLAAELSAYDAADPTRAPVKVDAASGEHVGQSPEEFLEALEADEVVHKAHH
jgi:F-type H+-transporting ATPase subunit h